MREEIQWHGFMKSAIQTTLWRKREKVLLHIKWLWPLAEKGQENWKLQVHCRVAELEPWEPDKIPKRRLGKPGAFFGAEQRNQETGIMVGISMLDNLEGLRLSNRKAAKTALYARQVMLSETGNDCMYLVFRSDEVRIVKDETIVSLEMKLAEMRAKGHDTIDGYRS
jgi:hypothetical protein